MHDIILQNLIRLQEEVSATEQHSTNETGIFFSPTTKLLSLVSNTIVMQTSQLCEIRVTMEWISLMKLKIPLMRLIQVFPL